ncbi:MAG: paraquat-inducible protein A [Pseudomonadales bacterium]
MAHGSTRATFKDKKSYHQVDNHGLSETSVASDHVPNDLLIGCHECAAIYRQLPLPKHGIAECRRCGAELYRHIPNFLNRTLALSIAALVLWIIANLFPYLSLKAGGLVAQNFLAAAAWSLFQHDMGELGLVVLLTSIAFPFLVIIGLIYLLLPVAFGYAPWQAARVYQLVKVLQPWSLVGVFMLGTLIAIVKLEDLANVIPGLSLYALTALLLVYSFANASFNSQAYWQLISNYRVTVADLTASDQVLQCHICDALQPDPARHSCGRCGLPVHYRTENSVQQSWALVAAATLMLIPANIYPVMTVKKLGKGGPDTIISGITNLLENGLYGLGLIVLFASIIVPFTKLIALSYLLYSVQSGSNWRPRDRTLLYRVTEIIGAWSMVDVFLVGLLAGLVNLGLLASVTPGIGATFFGAAVILTMLAAQRFDPRLIWDTTDEHYLDMEYAHE